MCFDRLSGNNYSREAARFDTHNMAAGKDRHPGAWFNGRAFPNGKERGSIPWRPHILNFKVMPILKKTDVRPLRPIIMVVYGTPGTGKTSSANTSENPLLIDCDRGFDRASNQVDTLTAQTWEDILVEEHTMKDYKTIIVDTAKSMLDDFLTVYGVKQDYKLAKNKLKLFGYIADEFKSFVNRRRADNTDIIFVCHDKETSEGDVIRHAPDCTGQSKDLLLRIADQVGFITMINGKRTICFDPTDTTVGKNVAQIPPTVIPDCNTIDFSTFMADIINKVKASIQSKTEEQRKAMEALEQANITLEAVKTVEDANRLIEISQSLNKAFEKPFKIKMIQILDEKGFIFDKTSGKFIEKDEKKGC